MSKPSRRSNCPLHLSLNIVGDRWTLLILRDFIFEDARNFREFIRKEGVATNILSDRLNRLVENDIIQKEEDPTNASAIRYSLTRKGLELVPALIELYKWGSKHTADNDTDKQLRLRLEQDRQGLTDDIINRLVITHQIRP